MTRNHKRLLPLLLSAAMLSAMLGGCKPGKTESGSSSAGGTAPGGIPYASGENLITEGRAKGFVRLSDADREKYGAIAKETLFVPETAYSNGDKTVCIANVVQYGAKGDGVTDDSEAFRSAILAAQNQGGGTVFVPEGAYYVPQTLALPNNVLLRGEFDTPETSGYGGGTTLLTDYGVTGIYSGAFLSLSSSAGVRNIAVYYLNQSFESPLDLAPCIGLGSAANMVVAGTTVENVLLYNASYPLYYGGCSNAGHEFNNIWATPLKIGLLTDNNGDVTNFVNMYMDAQYYADCGFTGAPQSDTDREKLATALRGAVAYIFERHDTPYANSLYAYGIGTGLIVRESSNPNRTTWENSGGFDGGCQLYNFEFTGCHTGIRIEKVLVSVSFMLGKIGLTDAADATGVQITGDFNRQASFDSILFEGKPANVVDNACTDGNIQFSNCSFADWRGSGVLSKAGHIYLTNCAFGRAGGEIKADGSAALGVVGCTFAGTPEISAAGIEEGNYLFSADRMKDLMPSPTTTYDFMQKRPSAAKFDIFNAADYGMDEFGEDDCSEALNKALTAAGDNGGGIVYVPAGEYRLDKPLYVPEGVELRGPLETYHSNSMTRGADAVFYVYGGVGEKEGDGAVVLAKNAGVMGLTFYYPEQSVTGYRDGEDYIPYPYTITAKGPGCWVMFTVCVNSYNMLDFGSAPDTADYVIYGVRGQPLKVGVFGGNNSGTGRVERCNFSLAEWCYGTLPYRVYFGPGTYDAAGMEKNAEWKAYVMDLLTNCDYYLFGYNKNLLVYGNLAYATRYGLRFIGQDGKFTENAKTFYHCTDVCTSTVKIEKAGHLFMVNSFSDCEMEENNGAVVDSYLTPMNTVFDQALTVKGGDLRINGLNLHRGYDVFLNVTGGTVNFSSGIVTDSSEVFIKADGDAKVSLNGVVFRKRRGLITDTDLFVVEKNGNAQVTIDRCMGTNKN